MRRRNKFLIFVASLLAALLPPFVSAQSLAGGNIPGFMNTGFQGVFRILNTRGTQAGITIALFFFTIYSISLAGLKRVKTFQEGDKVSRSGKMVAFAFSGLSTMGLFFLGRQSFYAVVEKVLEVMNVFGMIVLGLVLFLLTYYGFKQGEDKYPCAALMAAGLAFILPAYMMQWEGWYSFGWLLLIVGGIWCLIKMFGGGKSSGSSGGNSGNNNSSDRGNRDRRSRDRGDDRGDKSKHGTLIVSVHDHINGQPIDRAEILTERRGTWKNPVNWINYGWLPNWAKGLYRHEAYTGPDGQAEIDPTRIGAKGIIITKRGYFDPNDHNKEYLRVRSRTVLNQNRNVRVTLWRNPNTTQTPPVPQQQGQGGAGAGGQPVSVIVEFRYPGAGIDWSNQIITNLPGQVDVRIRRPRNIQFTRNVQTDIFAFISQNRQIINGTAYAGGQLHGFLQNNDTVYNITYPNMPANTVDYVCILN